MTYAIEMSHVFVRTRRTAILGDISLCVPRGALLAILGPNGAGKTTLLNIIPALIPFEGTVKVLGHDLSKLSSLELVRLRRRIGYVPQMHTRPSPVLPLSVREVVEMGRVGPVGIARTLTEEDRATCDSVIKQLELEEIANRPFGLLSGGEQRKVALARAVAQKPDVLLLDEPAAHLDLRWQEIITQLVGSLWRALGITVVMITHDPRHLPQEVTHVAALQGGKFSRMGTPDEVMESEFISMLYNLPLNVTVREGRYLVLPSGAK